MSKWWENSDLWIVVILALAIIGRKLATTVSTLADEVSAVSEPTSGEAVITVTPPASPESADQWVHFCPPPVEVIVVTPDSASATYSCH